MATNLLAEIGEAATMETIDAMWDIVVHEQRNEGFDSARLSGKRNMEHTA
jgi:hypothetical protein